MNKIIVVAGPTASGKTDLGRIIAEKYNGVVVSVDSRQIYRELDLGTGKDKTFHQEMIDIINPPTGVYPVNTLEVITGYTPVFSVNKFQKYGLEVINKIYNQGKLPILVGGTGYYLDALLFDKKFPDVSIPKIQSKLNNLSDQELSNLLAALDPESAKRCANNRRRMLRALEVVLATGKPVPELSKNPRFNHRLIILDQGEKLVDEKIKTRLQKRLQQGMVGEVKQLLKKVDPNWLINLGLEYKYITRHLIGELTREEMQDQLLTATRQYSRRQRTWWKRYGEAVWIDKPEKALPIADKFILTYNRNK